MRHAPGVVGAKQLDSGEVRCVHLNHLQGSKRCKFLSNARAAFARVKCSAELAGQLGGARQRRDDAAATAWPRTSCHTPSTCTRMGTSQPYALHASKLCLRVGGGEEGEQAWAQLLAPAASMQRRQPLQRRPGEVGHKSIGNGATRGGRLTRGRPE